MVRLHFNLIWCVDGLETLSSSGSEPPAPYDTPGRSEPRGCVSSQPMGTRWCARLLVTAYSLFKQGSAGPPGPARIATGTSPAAWWSGRRQRWPSGTSEDRNYGNRLVYAKGSWAALALRDQRGSQLLDDPRGHAARPGSAGPPGPARIATLWMSASSTSISGSAGLPGPARIATSSALTSCRTWWTGQRWPSGTSEDRNPKGRMDVPAVLSAAALALRDQRGSQPLGLRHRPSTGRAALALRDRRRSQLRVTGRDGCGIRAALALRDQRGSQRLPDRGRNLRSARSAGPRGPARIATMGLHNRVGRRLAAMN